ncbi:P-loop containing nucleoside triphosphate hydrolase protein [Hypoxylon cercidicola]|nr:P-loop containing nucleoside triphosphate hydrolase protein [Hypoxylon cercidicola]
MAARSEETSHNNDVSDVQELQKQVHELVARVAQLEAERTSKDTKPGNHEEEIKTTSNDANADNPTYLPTKVRLIYNRRDPESKTGERKDFEETQASELNTKNSRGAGAILRIFLFDSKEDADILDTYSQLEIFYGPLRELLRRLLAHHPTHEFYQRQVMLESPFEPLVQNWDLLKREVNASPRNEEEKNAREALGNVLEVLEHQQNKGDSRLNDYLSTRDLLMQSKSITFDALWTIFSPGTIVYGRPCLKLHHIFIVEDCQEAWPSPGDKIWSLDCWAYDWDGHHFKRRPITLTFPRFSGTRPITGLPYYPLALHDNSGEIKDHLLQRGRRYREYCTAKSNTRRFKYNGKAIVDKVGFATGTQLSQWGAMLRRAVLDKDVEDEGVHIPEEPIVKSEVMVDFESYYQYGPGRGSIGIIKMGESSDECTCNHCFNNDDLGRTYYRKYDEATGEEENWEDLQFMLLPPRVLGYILREKQWAQLEVDKLEDPSDDKKAFIERLHLKGDSLSGEDTKELLLNLVTNHGKDQVKDLTEDKGKGIVILLYGSPGVGKTSTAETIAAAAEKPLFSIGVADVGTQSKNVESNLRKVFDLATRWKAILLIDEVDVFVQSRAIGHQGPTTERNALVSVFLRVLEYFQGILILTTNQIALFDIAIQSRIHIAIKYTELDKEQVQKIFMQFLDQYNKKGLIEEYPAIAKFAKNDLHKKGFDGRQLRNLVASAMGCAQARPNGKMTMDDITMIVSNMESFKGDLAYQMRRYQEVQSGGARGNMY